MSMLDAMASLLTFNAGMYFATGTSPRRRGNAHPTISPYETFEAADGWLNIGVANDKFWTLFCGVLDRPGSAGRSAFRPRAGSRRQPRRAEGPARAAVPDAGPRPDWVAALGRRRHAVRRDQDGRRSLREPATDRARPGPGRRAIRRPATVRHVASADPLRRRAAAARAPAAALGRAPRRAAVGMARPGRGRDRANWRAAGRLRDRPGA